MYIYRTLGLWSKRDQMLIKHFAFDFIHSLFLEMSIFSKKGSRAGKEGKGSGAYSNINGMLFGTS